MPTIPVSSTAALVRALQTAQSGDVITLASGVYSGVAIKNISKNGNVTITSADSAHKAVFTDLMVRDSSGVTFANIDFNAKDGAANNSFQVYGSHGIAFDRIELAGPDNLGSGKEQSAFMIRKSQDISVTNSEFHHLWHGVSLLDNTDVTLTGNYFHDIRTDGIRGGGNSALQVSGNLFTDFYPAPGDHPDAIQLWTSNTTVSASDIAITDNVVLRGKGEPIQGIYFYDQVGTLPFKNVTIADNLVVGGLYNGIAITHVDGGVISGNTVLAMPGQKSWIYAKNDIGLSVVDNVATDLLFETDTAARLAANDYALAATDGGAAALYGWLDEHGDFGGAWGSAAAIWTTVALEEPTAAAAAAFVLISGTAGADRLTADARFDSRVEGGAGNDVLTGGTLLAQLAGGTGDDTYTLKSVGDQVIETGSGGNDTVAVGFNYTLTANVEALRMTGNGQIGIGNTLDNRLVGSTGNDTLSGLDGDDSLQGGAGNDILYGGLGVDALKGEAGNDTLRGGDGNDSLLGGAGNDLLDGGIGNDVLTGGTGEDTYRFRPEDVGGGQSDTITDFQRGQDVVNLALIDANTRTAANDGFRFIGTQGFHGVAGELRYDVSGGAAHVYGDLNGDRIPDFVINMVGVTTLSAADFVL